MFKFFIFLAVALTAQTLFAQTNNSVTFLVKNHDTKAAIADVSTVVKNTDISATTDANGRVQLNNIPAGEQTIEISSLGYDPAEIKLTFPLTDATERTVFLEINNEVGEVTIMSTRSGREIEAEPSRVEAIDEEEIDEKISMAPSNVSMVVSESTGIQVQQTSATSNTQSVRIQGLDGRYTQILKDGFPSYGGFSGSTSLLEIPPLDLKQVEIIKGPSATIYGAGAIAGVVNFISKEPGDKPVTTIVLNQTSALGTDFSFFNSKKFNSFGYTFLGSANYQREYDVDDDHFTELPRTKSFAVNPRFFFDLDDKTKFTVGNSLSYQTRSGGDIFAIRDQSDDFHRYFENNDFLRNVTTFNFDRSLSDGSRFVARQSLAYFSRDLNTPDHRFKGDQFNSYTDLAYFRTLGTPAAALLKPNGVRTATGQLRMRM